MGQGPESENRIEDPAKAETMARAEDVSQTLAANAEKGDLPDLAAELRGEAREAGEQAGQEFDTTLDKVDAFLKEQTKEIAKFAESNHSGSYYVLYGQTLDSGVEIATDKLYAVLGATPPSAERRVPTFQDGVLTQTGRLTSETNLGLEIEEMRFKNDDDEETITLTVHKSPQAS